VQLCGHSDVEVLFIFFEVVKLPCIVKEWMLVFVWTNYLGSCQVLLYRSNFVFIYLSCLASVTSWACDKQFTHLLLFVFQD